jgi:hypothetical protein
MQSFGQAPRSALLLPQQDAILQRQNFPLVGQMFFRSCAARVPVDVGVVQNISGEIAELENHKVNCIVK